MTTLAWIYIFYAASFTIMGVAVLCAVARTPGFKLGRTFLLLALFGLTHGAKEWVDFAIELGWSAEGALGILSVSLMWVSFVLLLEFALFAITLRETSWYFAILPPVAAGLLAAVAELAGELSQVEADRIGRLLLALPATAAAAGAFFVLAAKLEPLEDRRLVWGARSAAVAFLAYNAVVAAKSPIFGLPPQLYRAACAVILAAASLFLLRGFWVQKDGKA